MKLYYSAGSCSTSCHITLEEAGLPYEVVEVDWDKPDDPNAPLVDKMNPLGTLPILLTGDGRQLDQNLSIHVYVADQAPEKKLLPPSGTLERALALNWLSFVATDLHKAIGGMFGIPRISEDQAIQAAARKYMLESATKYMKHLDERVAKVPYLCGEDFTPADAYAFVVLGWTKWLDVPLDPYKNALIYMARVAARPAVSRVLAAEGLV